MNWTLLLVGTHILCFFVGAAITFVVLCLCKASGDRSRREEENIEKTNDKHYCFDCKYSNLEPDAEPCSSCDIGGYVTGAKWEAEDEILRM